MKYLISLLTCMSVFTLQAQTTVTKKYQNGMPDTVWHINGVDTFLIEAFQLNGHLRARHWRKDSIYIFGNQGNIIEKKFAFKNNKKNYIPSELVSFGYWKEHIVYYYNGKIQMHAFWKNDTCFQLNTYEQQNTLPKSKTIRIHAPPFFEMEIQGDIYKEVTWLDTFTHIKQVRLYENGKLQRFEESRRFNGYTSKTQYIEYDTNQKVRFKWALDSNAVIPFKDNGLCLYGFINLKSDTITPACYERIHNISDSDYLKYYIVQQGTQYGVVDEWGNLIIPKIWSDLGFHQKHYGELENVLEDTYLQCGRETGHGLLKLNGQILLEPVYQHVGVYKNGLCEVRIGDLYGIVDSLGQIVVPPRPELVKFTTIPDVYRTEKINIKDDEVVHSGLIRKDGNHL